MPTETCDVHKIIEVEVPNVVRKKLADAKKILESSGVARELML